MADTDTDTPIYSSTSVHPMDRAPSAMRRVVGAGYNFVAIEYGAVTILLDDTGLDRLVSAISTFRASEAQAEAA